MGVLSIFHAHPESNSRRSRRISRLQCPGYFAAGTTGLSRAALIFLPVWAIGAGINMYLGVKRAGYSVADEAPIFLLVFAVPAAIALVAWFKYR
jgi:hypothetical protein